MTTLLLAKHDNKTLNDATAKALTAARAPGAPVHILAAGAGCGAGAGAGPQLGGGGKRRAHLQAQPPI